MTPFSRFLHMLFTALFLASLSCLAASGPKGHLLIIGGGDRTDDIMTRFIDLAGGSGKAHIVVLPMASATPDTTAMEQAEEFRHLGAQNVEWIQITHDQASNDTLVARLDSATGIFFSGGDQVRITKAILGTAVHKKLRELYDRGAVIGGTSAGAAIMSEVMLTGEELINHDKEQMFPSIMKGNVENIEGLSFLNAVIIDQHFVKRRRLNRLLSVVLEHPKLPGIGIDESTAIQVNPDGSAEVMGQGSVVAVDARTATNIHTDGHGNFGAHGVSVHIYTVGERFVLTQPEQQLPSAR